MTNRLDAALAFQHTEAGKKLISESLEKSRASGRKAAKARNSDPEQAFRTSVRGEITRCLRLIRDKRTPFGCSSHELRRHIESQFKDGMSWENHGLLWEIDHVCPISSFSPRDAITASHYTNLRPRPVHLNRIDGKMIAVMRGWMNRDRYPSYLR